MRLEKIIKKRRSIRRYQDKDIPDRIIEGLLDLARYAPSSMDGQPWHFFVVRNHHTKECLVRIKNKYCPPEKQEYRADFLLGAPAVIVVCVDRKRSFERGIENAVLATAHIMLAASQEGLGSVYMSAYKTNEPALSKEIGRLLGIPKKIDPITMIPIGYPDETLKPKKVKTLRKLITYDTPGKK